MGAYFPSNSTDRKYINQSRGGRLHELGGGGGGEAVKPGLVWAGLDFGLNYNVIGQCKHGVTVHV